MLTFDIPAPTGPYPTGTTALHLAGSRELMVSIWYPAEADAQGEVARYMPPKQALAWDEDLRLSADLGAAPGFVDLPNVLTHSLVDVSVRPGRHPVVLFSPGYYHSRFQNTALIEELASHGYIVVAIDHTGETPVEFPGGRLVPGTGEPVATTPAYRAAIAARVADTRFVLDQLADLPLDLDLDHIGMFGFSAGGFTTAGTMYVDARIIAGADLDGPLADDKIESPTSEISDRGLDQPFLLYGSGEYDLSWENFRKAQRGWTQTLELPGAKHIAFTDLLFIYPDLLRQLLPNDPDLRTTALTQTIGTIDPHQSLLAQRTHLTAYFDRFISTKGMVSPGSR